MTSALVIGGTGFIGRHTGVEFREQGYDVTVLSRGDHPQPTFTDGEVSFIECDRTDPDALAATADEVAADIVIDCALFHPDDAERAIDIFAEVDAYVYVSSGGVYARNEIPKRETETPLHEFSPDHADDTSMATYGPRKAECDRIVRNAAERGVAATVVRPTMVYGPKTVTVDEPAASGSVSWAPDFPGIQDHHDYWIHRINEYDKVVVPGDGTAIWHRVYVEDVATALRVVAEHGAPGEAYNAADRRIYTIEDVIELIAESLDTSVDVVYASRRELEPFDLTPGDFVLYHHIGHNYPHVLATCNLSSLGWRSTAPEVALERTIEESLASDRDGNAFDPGRASEERFLESVVD